MRAHKGRGLTVLVPFQMPFDSADKAKKSLADYSISNALFRLEVTFFCNNDENCQKVVNEKYNANVAQLQQMSTCNVWLMLTKMDVAIGVNGFGR